jgi:hypothetical protein
MQDTGGISTKLKIPESFASFLEEKRVDAHASVIWATELPRARRNDEADVRNHRANRTAIGRA